MAVFWNEKEHAPEQIIEKNQWAESFSQWSPLGSYLTTIHAKGVLLWGGQSWRSLKRFVHPGVNLVDISPNENYVVTWSHQPFQGDKDDTNYVIWDMDTIKSLQSFAIIDPPDNTVEATGSTAAKKLQWPAFKWSADDRYVARMTETAIHVYELPGMHPLNQSAINIESIMEFEWAPARLQRDGVKDYEQLLCFWTPEIGANPAKVSLMSIPSREVVRTRNMFHVSDVKLHWQSQAAYICVKVDRHSKSKKG